MAIKVKRPACRTIVLAVRIRPELRERIAAAIDDYRPSLSAVVNDVLSRNLPVLKKKRRA